MCKHIQFKCLTWAIKRMREKGPLHPTTYLLGFCGRPLTSRMHSNQSLQTETVFMLMFNQRTEPGFVCVCFVLIHCVTQRQHRLGDETHTCIQNPQRRHSCDGLNGVTSFILSLSLLSFFISVFLWATIICVPSAYCIQRRPCLQHGRQLARTVQITVSAVGVKEAETHSLSSRWLRRCWGWKPSILTLRLFEELQLFQCLLVWGRKERAASMAAHWLSDEGGGIVFKWTFCALLRRLLKNTPFIKHLSSGLFAFC